MIYEKYKNDFWALLVLGIIFVLYCTVFWGRWGDVMVDCPRELYIPQRISEGQGLYTNIFSLYSPLGYYLNAFFVKIFGNSLNLFYLLGCVNTGIVLTFVYLISRRFSKPLLSFGVSLAVLCYCCISFSPITNYFFPYSYSVVYALTCFLASVYLLIYYFKTNFKTKYLLFFCLLGGFCTAFKFEFAPVFLPLFLVLIVKERTFKKIISGLLCFIVPVILPFLVNIEGVKTFIDNFLAFCSSPSSREFLKTMSLKTPRAYIISTLKDILTFLVLFVPSVFVLLKSEQLSKSKKIGAYILCFLFVFGLSAFIFDKRIYLFSWLTLVSLWFIFKYFRSEKTDFDFLTFVLSSVLFLSSLRVGGYLASNHYGKYYLPLFLTVFFCLYLPQILKKYYNEKYLSFVLIVFSFFNFCFCAFSVYQGKNYKINTDKGTIFATYSVGKTVEQTAKYIAENTSEQDRVLVLPEGLMINYLANRKSDDMFYQLLPNHIEILGEENIVKKMSKNPSEYIVLTSLTTGAYGKTYFCSDYAQKICDFINENYDYLEVFENKQNNKGFMMMVLKLKKF